MTPAGPGLAGANTPTRSGRAMPAESESSAGTGDDVCVPDQLDRRQFARRVAWLGAAVGFPALARAQDRKPAETGPVRVRVWCEGAAPKAVYPDDVDGALGDDLR